MMPNILHVQEGDWQRIETSPKPVLVDFWAEWCAPCRILVPTIDKLAEKYGSEISFAKVNVDELAAISHQFFKKLNSRLDRRSSSGFSIVRCRRRAR